MTNNLAHLLVTRAIDRPDMRIGVVDAQMDLRDAVRQAAGGARFIRESGVGDDDRVALVASNSTDYLVTWMACVLARIPVALINPTYPRELLDRMLAAFEPALVFTDLPAGSLGGEHALAPIASRSQWEPSDPTACPGLAADSLDIVSFMHTSGTTGVPKFCAQSHSYFLRMGRVIARVMCLTPDDRMLAPLPLFHINPMGIGLMGCLTAGADLLSMTKFSASGFWPTVHDQGVTALTLHAPPLEILKRATTPEQAAGHRVRTLFFADTSFMERYSIPQAVSVYGSTEAAGFSHVHEWRLGSDMPDDASRWGGMPRPDIEDRIDGDGYIFVREREPGTLFAGYFANGRLDPNRDEDGWFATGDLGRRDSSGALVFIERGAESIRVKGEFVPIAYVEERLSAIKQLTDYALWKRAGDLVDDEVVLYVVADDIPVDAIRAVSQGLPSFMRPAHVAHVAAIPRDAGAGKVQRRLLQDQQVLSWIPLA
jgi:carnitine-CoA ligase